MLNIIHICQGCLIRTGEYIIAQSQFGWEWGWLGVWSVGGGSRFAEAQ